MKIESPFLKKQFLKRYLYIIALIAGACLKGQTINIAGTSWTASVPAITEAGSNYIGTYENPSQLTLSGNLPGSFLNVLSASGAKISMQLAPTSWNSSLKLYAKRSGGTTKINGLCLGCTATITGGTANYIEILQASAVTLSTITFTGLLGISNSVDYSAISVQLEISGVSVTIPAAAYSTQVVFTIGAN
ncbi:MULTISPECIES: hypothetical protein [unclassified Chryseobacterium]|uniref:hypothetical protein n=1 Tax=unclassified Chryseobacterium TaxID=2593645 RepID=UPI000D716666|nr:MULTISPECIES: hypothetical protein [unclassified Chryseobacterium]PWW16231.1 hypothetical protein DEU40_13226 [Chryseobacterium sp. AG844]